MGIHFFILYVITKINLKFRKFNYNNFFIFIFFNLFINLKLIFFFFIFLYNHKIESKFLK